MMAETAGTSDRVRRCVANAIADVNSLRPVDEQVPTGPDTVLAGEGGVLDSLGLVNFAVALETLVEQEFGATPGLVAEILGASDPAPFRTIALMETFVAERLPDGGR